MSKELNELEIKTLDELLVNKIYDFQIREEIAKWISLGYIPSKESLIKRANDNMYFKTLNYTNNVIRQIEQSADDISALKIYYIYQNIAYIRFKTHHHASRAEYLNMVKDNPILKTSISDILNKKITCSINYEKDEPIKNENMKLKSKTSNKSKKIIKIAYSALMVLLCSGLIALITYTPKCDKENDHVHKYTYGNYVTYRVGERKYNNFFRKTDETIQYTEEIRLMDEFNLLRIDDNLSIIELAVNNHQPYLLYEYEYSGVMGDPAISFTSTDYTTDPNNPDLKYTGIVREVCYKYLGYSIEYYEENESSYVHLVSSGWVDNLLDIKEKYPYFKIFSFDYNFPEQFISNPYYINENKLEHKK